MVSDRYVFDRAMKADFSGKQKWQKILFRVSCRLSKKPRYVFLLVDKPEEIYARKQELSVADIGAYQTTMRSLLKEYKLNNIDVSVAGRHPDEIAAEVFDRILIDLGVDVFSLLSAWESRKRWDG